MLNSLGKKVTVNNNTIKKVSDYISNINVVMFSPDDLEIINSSPAVRRKYMNVCLSQMSKDYLLSLNKYNKVLKSRNNYLKINFGKIDKIYLDILTNELIDSMINILKYRKKFIKTLNILLPKTYELISNDNTLYIEYNTFINDDDYYNNNLKEIIKEKYEKNFNNEILQKTTLFGIHRDDLTIKNINGNVSDFCSQGQKKIIVLCLKLSEIDIYKAEKKSKPIVLLDDILSEIDKVNSNKILRLLSKKNQIFITTTDLKM